MQVRGKSCLAMTVIAYGLGCAVFLVPLLFGSLSLAHRADRPDLNDWFMHLKSSEGLCCDFSEAESIADPDWDTQDGHYRVFLEGKWYGVRDTAVVHSPNRYGPALVWPMRYKRDEKFEIYDIRCFMPGAGT